MDNYNANRREELTRQNRLYEKKYVNTLFKKAKRVQKRNNITTNRARIMAFMATYTECQNCGKVENNNRALSVDHDHDTGKLRGVLCQSCNNKDVFAGRGEVL